MRGYDRDQVIDFFRRFDAEMRVIAADRDAATANARELADNLELAREEIEELRREVNKLSVPPTTVQGMSERVSSMLRLASDEASEIRARSEAEAAETLSIARQEAEEHRQEIARQTQEMNERREAMNAEHETTMHAAHDRGERQSGRRCGLVRWHGRNFTLRGRQSGSSRWTARTVLPHCNAGLLPARRTSREGEKRGRVSERLQAPPVRGGHHRHPWDG